MSYILDALKRAEQQRGGPTRVGTPVTRPVVFSEAARWWPWIAAAFGGLGLVVAAVALWPTSAPTPGATAPGSVPAAASAPAVAAAPAVASAPVTAPAPIVPSPPAVVAAPPVAAPTPTAPPVAVPAPVPPPAVAAPRAPIVRPPADVAPPVVRPPARAMEPQLPAAPERRADAKASPPPVAERSVTSHPGPPPVADRSTATRVTTSPVTRPAARPEERVTPAAPPEVVRAAPQPSGPEPAPAAPTGNAKALAAKISMQVLSWAPEPKDRFVFLNGRKYGEGQTIDGMLIEHITEDGVTLSFQGERVTLKNP